MDDLSTANTAVSGASQALTHLASLAAINWSVSPNGFSTVCPHLASCFSLEDISGAEVEIRTVDYIFPMNQSMPNPKPKTWIVNILTRHPQAEDCYKVTAVLFTCAGSPEESRIVFEGHGYFHTSEISLTLLGFCNLVKDTGIGIFAGATEGRASFANHWGRKIHKSPPPESELSAPGLRLCPVSWTFLLSRELARALELALSRENVPIIFDWGERGRPPWIT